MFGLNISKSLGLKLDVFFETRGCWYVIFFKIMTALKKKKDRNTNDRVLILPY